MGSLYNMGNLTAVKDVSLGGGGVRNAWRGGGSRSRGWGGGIWLKIVDGPAIFRSEEEVPDF